MTKQKGPDSTRSRGIAKEKIVPVAEGSQQPRAPGWVAPGSANVQSANIEQMGAALRSRGSLQGGIDNPNVGTQRGGAGAQQAGWSARQSAQRMQARGEEDRLNASRQSGYGGMEQQQKGGSLESSTGSMQSDTNMPRQGDQTAQPASDNRSKKSRKRSIGTKK
ncbi:hypothetical protein HAV22_05840 [Massilia sp. TW-1]|uniref:Uncharacterized protein n=1 Tax=Telluria antibiotica TaxID=2717319 RepID=A0ABX0P923_9BURK|nr:hypothetical protein [Telluria antibiotica]NIA53174.1 hypothetical protein [Telluria antibiotica]